jgi:hypothetical protein
MTTSTGDNGAPYVVAIVAMGPSHADYVRECISKSSRRGVADETWAINAMAGIIEHDRAIIMDDLPYFAKAAREANPSLAGYQDWLAKHPGPIYAQRKYAEFPGAIPYPLEGVLNDLGYAYFNTTVAYAIGLAIAMEVKHMKLYGIDFTYANNRGFAEAGRACVEYWLGVAISRGIRVTIAPSSTLCDQANGRQLYGWTKPPVIRQTNGKFQVQTS